MWTCLHFFWDLTGQRHVTCKGLRTWPLACARMLYSSQKGGKETNQRNRLMDLQLLHPISHIYDIVALHQSNNHHLNSSKQTTSEQSLVPSVASPTMLKLFEEPSECFPVPLPTSPACRVAGVINVSMKQVSFTIPGGQIRIVVGKIPLKGR